MKTKSAFRFRIFSLLCIISVWFLNYVEFLMLLANFTMKVAYYRGYKL